MKCSILMFFYRFTLAGLYYVPYVTALIVKVNVISMVVAFLIEYEFSGYQLNKG